MLLLYKEISSRWQSLIRFFLNWGWLNYMGHPVYEESSIDDLSPFLNIICVGV